MLFIGRVIRHFLDKRSDKKELDVLASKNLDELKRNCAASMRIEYPERFDENKNEMIIEEFKKIAETYINDPIIYTNSLRAIELIEREMEAGTINTWQALNALDIAMKLRGIER